MGGMQLALKNTFLELVSDGNDDVGIYASSCPGSLEYEDRLSELQDDIAEVRHDTVEVESASKVGAMDPDDGFWSSLPPYCHDIM